MTKKTRKVTKHNIENIDSYQTLAGPEERPEYYCTYCNFLLTVKVSQDEYWCNRCSVSHFPNQDQLKKKSKLITPQRNIEPCISSIPSGYEGVSIKKKTEPQGTFKLLQDRGLKIKDYWEEVP
jgi:hypothetical protein